MKTKALLLVFCLYYSFTYSQNIVPQQNNLVLGERTVLWIRGFNPATDTWNGSDQEINTVYNAWNDYVSRNSYNTASIAEFDITPVYTFNATNSGGMVDQLRAAARAGGYDVDSYNTVAFHFAANVAIGGGAVGSGNGARGTMLIPTAATAFFPGVVHEGIHTMGLGHAEGLDGGNNIYPGINKGGVDPYFFMGSEGPDARLKADMNTYFKYRLGWINASNVRVQSTSPSSCVTRRLYKSSNIQNYDPNRIYAMQLGAPNNRIWLSYEPNTFNLDIQNKGNTGTLIHFLPRQSPAVSRLLDAHPNSIIAPGKFSTVADFWDAALKEGEQFFWETAAVTILSTGGTGDNQWVDVEVCNCLATTGDDDNDGICNQIDVCSGGDDNMDNDNDDIPDFCDECPDDPDNDENNNGVCDNLECLSKAKDDFDYIETFDVSSASGNSDSKAEGWKGNWYLTSEDKSTSEIAKGSLTHPLVTSSGNKIRIKHDTKEEVTSLVRKLDYSFKNGESFWIDFLIRGNKIGYGGMFIEPQELHQLSVGKSWNTDIGIANIPSGVFMNANTDYWVVAKWTLETTGTRIELWVNPTPGNFNENRPRLTEFSNTVLFEVDRIEIVHSLNAQSSDYEMDEITVGCNPPTILSACAQAGSPCDDNSNCTENDVYDENCNCYGVLIDADFDEICDLDDPDVTSCSVNSPCDDNDDCTINDVYDSECNCIGEFLDENDNNICDEEECSLTMVESFEYAENSSINGANGGFGFDGSWSVNNTAINGKIEIEKGSLVYDQFISKGNRLRVHNASESPNINISRTASINLASTDTIWVSFLIRANQLKSGGVWLRLNDRQDIALGKRTASLFGIDNNSNENPIEGGTTHWFVARYAISPSGVEVNGWIDPKLGSFDINNPDLSKTVNRRLASINSINIRFDNSISSEYELDEFTYGCKAPYPLSNSSKATLSVNSFEKDFEITISPNPTKDMLFINKNSPTDYNISMYTLSGQVIFENKSTNEIDMSSLNSGIYFLKISNSDLTKTTTRKVIKN
ncbi:T9SS type A sorting domain-containing protein [Aquimarina sp. ERC-38]|uniref:T9SS type A sorting domain-containing protein n=1 Tax=Aquimarina sp. ERC-38 TaxID=2949996 RepID=UPI0022465056|nr:T9SS type A sorting domain-containing protein [Aquimarina sp. ERC-38]UZO79562.1 T9SS type A sorting domain-containing protein [Aquimarina sp. ERC-38]